MSPGARIVQIGVPAWGEPNRPALSARVTARGAEGD